MAAGNGDYRALRAEHPRRVTPRSRPRNGQRARIKSSAKTRVVEIRGARRATGFTC
jgi:hypothetical protein